MAFRHLLRTEPDTGVARACLFFIGDTIIIQKDNNEYLSYYKVDDVESVEQIQSALGDIQFVPDNDQMPRSGDMFVRGSINCLRT